MLTRIRSNSESNKEVVKFDEETTAIIKTYRGVKSVRIKQDDNIIFLDSDEIIELAEYLKGEREIPNA